MSGNEAKPSLSEDKTSSPLENSFDPKKIEAAVRARWREMNLRQQIETKFSQRNSKRQGYVDGPPTLNGEPHMGHLRGRVMKDLWYRFETLRGSDIDFRGGWDCQGLPVELQAEKELGLTGNKTSNLKAIGEETLVEACKRMVNRYHSIWQDTDEKIGLLINDSKAYWTYHDSYIEREWQILKAAWNGGILSEGYRVTPYCPNCQTSLSAAEVALGGYENIEDPSLYFKMKVRAEGNALPTFLLVWTTMPFTVVTDELVGSKPDADYCYVLVHPSNSESSETWIVGADRLEALMKELHIGGYTITKRVKGADLEGLHYEHPLAQLIPKQGALDSENDLVHSVVAEDFVDITTGSGLVHMSPANGEDDFEVSRRRGIPVFNPIDEQAVFTQDAGVFAGLFVRDADQKVADELRNVGALVRLGRIKHEYPICWRSGHRLVWLARREYFYFVDRLGDHAVHAAEDVEYYYDAPMNRFVEIVKEKRPWCISRERVWGTPLPIWRCPKCSERFGLFSREEIVKMAKALPDGPGFELHRPWIDRITIPCPKCGSDMKREQFVLDTWHNSGAAPYASYTDKEYREYVPVPFLTEGIDQTRGWAYSLLIENVLLQMKAQSPYKAFLFMGHVLDENGEKLSKSKGNFVPVRQLIEQNSVDLIRLYLNWKAGPIDSINFSRSEMVTRPYQILSTLYFTHVFYMQNSTFDGFSFQPSKTKKLEKNERMSFRKEDKWILSRLGLLVDACTEAYSESRYHEAARAIEHFLIDELSQTYIPIVRGELWEETEEARQRRYAVYTVLAVSLYNVDVLLHPIAPFVTDYLSSTCFGTEALLLNDWPESAPEFRDERLEVEFDMLSKVLSLTNSARMKGKLKRRWPLAKAYYLAEDAEKDLVLANEDLILEQANLKEIEIVSDPKKMPIVVSVKPNFEILAPKVKSRMSEVSSKLANVDAATLFNEIANNGKAKLDDIEITLSDIVFSFSPADPRYIVAENYGIVLALDTTRDKELEAQGKIRDLARNLQSLRKKKGYNPTDVLEAAKIAGLGSETVDLLSPKSDQLAFLVRVKKVELLAEKPAETERWQEAELDGAEIKIDIS